MLNSFGVQFLADIFALGYGAAFFIFFGLRLRQKK